MASGTHYPDRIAGYDVLSVLGYGANSTIYAVSDRKTRQLYALKRVIRSGPSDQKFVDQTINEHRVARRVDHPVIRKSFKLKRRRLLWVTRELLLIMEMVDGRALIQQRPATERELVEAFMSVADGLMAMHYAGYVHADIKPHNILIDEEGRVKIIDLGQSCPMNTTKQRIQGTPDYIAPEQVRRQPLTAKTDIFNLGATLYWCVTDQFVPTLMPKNDNEVGLREETRLHEPRAYKPELPLALNSLIMDCLRPQPQERPASMKEVQARLEVVLRQVDRQAATQPTSSGR